MTSSAIGGRRASVDVRIGDQSEEFGEFRAGHHLLEDFGGVVEAARAELGFEFGELLCGGGAHPLGGHGAAIVEFCAVLDPLPNLRPADFGGGGVFHQVIDRNAAEPS